MKKIISRVAFGLLGLSVSAAIVAGPAEDRAAFQKFYENRFPDTPVADFQNGVYSILPAAREQWEEIEEFPPYKPRISECATRVKQYSGRHKRCYAALVDGSSH